MVVSNIGTVHEQLPFKTDRYVGGTRAEDGQEPGRCDTGSNLAKPITSSLFGSLRRNWLVDLTCVWECPLNRSGDDVNTVGSLSKLFKHICAFANAATRAEKPTCHCGMICALTTDSSKKLCMPETFRKYERLRMQDMAHAAIAAAQKLPEAQTAKDF